MHYLIANWKSHKNRQETKSWLKHFIRSLPPLSSRLKIIICPPSPYLSLVHQQLKPISPFGRSLHLGSQDISPFPPGNYTGAANARMFKDFVTFAIVGHSERRRYFKETNQEIANKVNLALDEKITPILCLDQNNLYPQLSALNPKHYAKIITAYEPVGAIGTGQPDTPKNANKFAQKVKTITEKNIPVLYGGSVNPQNISSFIDQEHINGVLVSSASLKPAIFLDLINAISKT
jgi:triosephosphate isomerase